MAEVKREYYPTGELLSEVFIFNNMKNGMYKQYYKNGQFKVICSYINDKLHGEYKSYIEQNNSYCIRTYNNGNWTDMPIVYCANGEILFHIGCDD